MQITIIIINENFLLEASAFLICIPTDKRQTDLTTTRYHTRVVKPRVVSHPQRRFATSCAIFHFRVRSPYDHPGSLSDRYERPVPDFYSPNNIRLVDASGKTAESSPGRKRPKCLCKSWREKRVGCVRGCSLLYFEQCRPVQRHVVYWRR